MVNEICKYCKLKSCESSGNEGENCPPQLVKLLETLKEGIHSTDCNVDYLIYVLPISKDELCFLQKNIFIAHPKG